MKIPLNLLYFGSFNSWLVNKGKNQLVATNSDLMVISRSSTCFGRLYAHHQEVGLCFTAYGFCPVVAVAMLGESGGKMYALWGWCCLQVVCTVQRILTESGNILCTVHTFCHLTLQHRNSYNRTETIGSETQSDLSDVGRKDARNMLRNKWSPLNHYLLHLVGSRLYLLTKYARSFEHKV